MHGPSLPECNVSVLLSNQVDKSIRIISTLTHYRVNHILVHRCVTDIKRYLNTCITASGSWTVVGYAHSYNYLSQYIYAQHMECLMCNVANIHNALFTGRELRSGVKCIVLTITQKIKSSNGRLWGCQTGAKSEHPKVVQNSSFEWVVEWLH